MEIVMLQYALWGAAGAAAAEVLEYYSSRQRNLRFNLFRGVGVVVASGLVTALYFVEIDPEPSRLSAVFQYGIFLALTIEEITSFLTTLPQSQPTYKPANLAGATVSAGGDLILDGFLSVFAVGCFGAVIAEFTRIRRKIKKLTAVDWVMSAVFIVISGFVTVLHGVEHINALTASQLGAAGPLVVTRIRS